MKKRERISAPAIGGSSLLVIFAVLCLTVFAMLSLSTAQAEKRLSEAAAEAVGGYYRADLEAEKIFSRLRSGEAVPGVQKNGEIYSYHCPISENQTLTVQLQRQADSWKVVCWRVKAEPGEVSQTLPVWDGR